MTDPHAETRRLFDELIELDTAARDARLRDCGADTAVIDEVSSLLVAALRAGDFLGLMQPGVGLVADRYRLERRLGGGAMGDVHLAWDQQLDRHVALKFLRASGVADPRAVARFRVEARAAARLEHPHVATVYDIGEAEGRQLFIAMAYYPGETLRERIAIGPLPRADALRIAAQIASALAAAHAAGIVHRDVKPANVLFDGEGAARLADFGIAKLLQEPDVVTHDDGVGTPAYMSPEQQRGDAVDPSADLWALGVLLHEMLTGHRPRRDGATSRSESLAHLDAGVRTLVDTLLTEDRARRPTGAAAVREALDQLLVAGTSSMRPRAPEVGRGALPAIVTRLVGRQRELADARRLLDESRLLTLIGPGGTGKTRLALELASSMREAYPNRIWFVPLAEIADASLVASSVAHALGLQDLNAAPLSERTLAALANEHALLVLDNMEHVLASAPFVATLLTACPAVRILVTSRTALGVQGEQTFHVPPLALPAPGAPDASSAEAVQFFFQRARAVRPTLTVDEASVAAVAEICRRLDGLPLALELAAARTTILSPRAILVRLEQRLDLLRDEAADRPARHSTMRAVIDWSYNLLTRDERTLFGRLVLFAGGASLEAVEAVARGVVTHDDVPFHVLELLSSLGGKSLLQSEEQRDGEPRFVMLETVREYGMERLARGTDERSALRAYGAYFVSFVERAAEHLRGPDQVAWLDRLGREYPNVRVAIEASLADPEGLEDAARMAVSLSRLWLARGPLFEGIDVMRRIMAAMDRPGSADLPTALRAAVFVTAAHLAGSRSVFAEARVLFSRALELYRELGDREGIAATLNNLAWQVFAAGDLRMGAALSREAQQIHEERGNALGVALSRNNLAWIAMERGDYGEADEQFSAVIASHERRGDARAVVYALGWHGALMERRGDLTRAATLYQRALATGEAVSDQAYRALVLVRLSATRHALGETGQHVVLERTYIPALRQFGRLWPLGYALNELGRMLLDLGEPERADRAFAEAIDARLAAGGSAVVAESQMLRAVARTRLDDVRTAADLLAASLACAIDYDGRPLSILGLESTVVLMQRTGQNERAAVLMAAASRAFDATGARRSPLAERSLVRARDDLIQTLGGGGFDAAEARGARLALDEATRLALAWVREVSDA